MRVGQTVFTTRKMKSISQLLLVSDEHPIKSLSATNHETRESRGTGEDEQDKQEATASLAAANDIGYDVAVLSELDNAFTLKEEARIVLKAFLGGKNIFVLLPAGFRRVLD